MAQSDQVVQNASFPAVRADINDNLAALFSQNSGNSAPTVTVAYQPWIDTSVNPAVWKVRNSTNTGWVTIGTLDSTTGLFSAGGVTPITSGGTGAITATAALTALLPSQTANSGKALITNGTLASWGVVAAGASLQVITTSSTYTPTAGKTTFLVIATAGGGASNSTAQSTTGGGGATGISLFTSVQMGASAAVTIGAGGAVNTGSSGGNTVFDPIGTGTTITANGGSGAFTSGLGRYPGIGGTCTGAQLNLAGGEGSTGGYSNGATSPGISFWGAGYGAGGKWDGTTAYDGSPGVVFVLEW